MSLSKPYSLTILKVNDRNICSTPNNNFLENIQPTFSKCGTEENVLMEVSTQNGFRCRDK